MLDPQEQGVVQVSDLTAYIKQLLEDNAFLQGIEVKGEVANLTYHRSGHVYFTLKDAQSQLSAVMFKLYALNAERMEVGDEIIAKGDISVYAPRGNYQLLVKRIQKGGQGDLFQQFLALRDRLKAEGVFDPEYKRSIPVLPKEIAVITSPTGAAVRDILRTLSRRYPAVAIKIYPAIVQGKEGKASLVKALELAGKSGADTLILARGGGSLEDLWNFNEEAVARAIFACEIPIITGVGHESDFTIADFVSDYRASTPTAAAEKAVPELAALKTTLGAYEQQLKGSLQHFLDVKRQILDDYSQRIARTGTELITEKRHILALLQKEIEGTDMREILKRGFTLTLKEGTVVSSPHLLSKGDRIDTLFASGSVQSLIDTVTSSEDER